MTKNKVRTLNFYGFDEDNTMTREKDLFPISKIEDKTINKY